MNLLTIIQQWNHRRLIRQIERDILKLEQALERQAKRLKLPPLQRRHGYTIINRAGLRSFERSI